VKKPVGRLFISAGSARSRLVAALAVVVAALAAVLVAPQSASASVWYYYEPSQSVTPQQGVNPWCTGSWWVVDSNNQPWILSGGWQCFSMGKSIYTGFSGPNRIGVVAAPYPRLPAAISLIAPDPGVDAFQQIAGVGKVVGFIPTDDLPLGRKVAIKGADSGLVYGIILYERTYPDIPGVLKCIGFSAPLAPSGDPGAPVFIHYGNQVYAAGVLIAQQVAGQYCFVPIQTLLEELHARLPMFPPGTQ
jgi:hypothetical protein